MWGWEDSWICIKLVRVQVTWGGCSVWKVTKESDVVSGKRQVWWGPRPQPEGVCANSRWLTVGIEHHRTPVESENCRTLWCWNYVFDVRKHHTEWEVSGLLYWLAGLLNTRFLRRRTLEIQFCPSKEIGDPHPPAECILLLGGTIMMLGTWFHKVDQ